MTNGTSAASPYRTLDRQTTETTTQYGLRALACVLDGFAYVLEDEALRAADHAYPCAVTGLGQSETDRRVLTRLTDARHQILAILRARAVAGDTPIASSGPMTPSSGADGGARVPVVPVVPTRPPAGIAVRVPDVAF